MGVVFSAWQTKVLKKFTFAMADEHNVKDRNKKKTFLTMISFIKCKTTTKRNKTSDLNQVKRDNNYMD